MLKAYILMIFLAFCVYYSEQDGSCDDLVMKVMSSKEVINIFKKSGHNKNGSLVANSCHGSGLYYTYTPGKLTSNYNSIGIELAMEALADFDSGFYNGTMTYGDIYQYPLSYDQGVSCEDIDYHPCPLPLKKGGESEKPTTM
ncbi:uncharacterized protein [Antedon mediterranea]|uniref:uncharacterized protein n=1 Tax=Antedon mediterranea TaxID=105859 RepID=UPI003AF5E577